MSDTEATRIELYDISKQKIDERYAELLMKNLPPDPERIARKDDVAVLGADLRTEMTDLGGSLRTEMADLGGSLRTEMADLGGSLRTEMADLRTEMADLGGSLRTEMADLRTELRTGLADVRTELRTGLAELRTDVVAQIHDATAAQTRTIVFGLFGSVTAMAVANIVAAGMLN